MHDRPHLLDALRDRVLLCDGGMGSRVQNAHPRYRGAIIGASENCTEVLNLSRPDLVREIHRGYFAAGADMVETNSFGGSPITLAEFDLGERARMRSTSIAGELAREAADSFFRRPPPLGAGQHRPRHQAADPGQHRLRPAGSSPCRAEPPA